MTCSKKLVNPYNIQPEDIEIEDIAHSLSLTSRANGHFKHFYSVAQHSINCAIEAKNRGCGKRVQLACLLHDATESYIADIPRPVKHRLVGYAEVEQKIYDTVFNVFGISDLTDEEKEALRDIDDAMLYYEFDAIMDVKIFNVAPYISMDHDFEYREMSEVCRKFIRLFKTLTFEINRKDVKVVGVDGCRGGWASFTIQGMNYDFKIYRSIADLCQQHKDAKYIIIDMPIGLPESIKDIRPDSFARQVLKGKASSVFNCPCRQAVYADKGMASSINKSVLGVGLSQQSIAIFPKIREIDSFLLKNSQYQNTLIESHPEVCFAMLNGSPIMEKKRLKEGAEKRLELLSRYYDLAREAYQSISIKESEAGADDIIDAICLALVGHLSLATSLKTLPEKPKIDPRGLPMQMVFIEQP